MSTSSNRRSTRAGKPGHDQALNTSSKVAQQLEHSDPPSVQTAVAADMSSRLIDPLSSVPSASKRTLPADTDAGLAATAVSEHVAKRAKTAAAEASDIGPALSPTVPEVNDDSEGTLSLQAARSTTPSNWAASPAVPPAEQHHPKFLGADHVPVAALERSLDFINIADAINFRYALSHLPTAAKWGTRYNSEKYLCVDNQHITVWLVGIVKSTWFTGEGGVPAARVSVGLHLPYEGDLEALHDLYKRGRPTPTKFSDRAFASCFQNRRPKGSSGSVNMPFDRIFNATEKLKAKSKMDKIPHTRLGRGDYVLLEAWINRYKTAGDKKVFGDWTEWLVSLELREISVLFAAPDGYIDDEDAPPPDIEDDM